MQPNVSGRSPTPKGQPPPMKEIPLLEIMRYMYRVDVFYALERLYVVTPTQVLDYARQHGFRNKQGNQLTAAEAVKNCNSSYAMKLGKQKKTPELITPDLTLVSETVGVPIPLLNAAQIIDGYTLQQVVFFMAKNAGKYVVAPRAVYEYWQKRNWRTPDGKPVNLSLAISVVNGERFKLIRQRNWSIDKEKRIALRELHAMDGGYIGDFYASPAWQELRARAFHIHGNQCQACGRTPAQHGVVLHVDHIKPRSTHPELELEFDNVQILCADCNKAKGNKYARDFRA